jgi:ketosteroid isomerase-like protein
VSRSVEKSGKAMRKLGGAAQAVLLFLAAGAMCAHEPTRGKGDDPAIRDVLLRNTKAFEAGDLQMADGVWAHDSDVTVFENGHANYGWEDYRDNHLKPEIEEMKNVRYELSDIKTRVDGKTAWATFKYTISADLKERHVDGAGLGTAVLEKRNGGWKIVHWHTSAPRKPPAPPEQKKP